jgi:HD superfamily phosphodiesterase
MHMGDRLWAKHGAGRLSKQEEIRFVGEAVRRKILMTLPHLGDQARLEACDLDAIVIPDSHAALVAREALDDVQKSWLTAHCLRTYIWGHMLAHLENIRFDAEVYYIAALLHDLGLTGEHAHAKDCGCFAVKSADIAFDLSETFNWDESRRHTLYDTISLHLNIDGNLKLGAEAYLLHEAASLDVIGARGQEIARPIIREVYARYPLEDMKKELQSVMRQEAELRRSSRVHLLVKLGFLKLIADNKVAVR